MSNPTPPPFRSAKKPFTLSPTIEKTLESTRAQLKNVEVATAIFSILCGTMAFFLLGTLLDHSISTGLPRWGRYGLCVGWCAFWITIIVRNILPHILYHIHPYYAAEVIEEHHPTLKNGLLNLLFLARSREDAPTADTPLAREVTKALDVQTAATLARITDDDTLDFQPVMRRLIALVVILVTLGTYMMLSSKDVFPSFARILCPWCHVEAPTRVRFLQISPTDTTLTQGDSLSVRAQIRNLYDSEPVTLFYSTTDSKTVNRPIPMTKSADGLWYECKVDPAGQGIFQPLDWRIEAGDKVSPTYHVVLRPPVRIALESVTLTYPKYTNLPKLTQTSGDIRAVEGTRITWRATTTQSLKRAEIQILDTYGKPSKTLSMQKSGQTSATLTHVLTRENTEVESERKSYRVRFQAEDERWSGDSTLFSLEIQSDALPLIRILNGPEDGARARVNDALKIEIEANDPDFGLLGVAICASWEGKRLDIPAILNVPRGKTPVTGTYHAEFEFRATDYDLRAGDAISWWVEATDARTPAGLRSRTTPRSLIIVDSESDFPAEIPADDPDDPADDDTQERPPYENPYEDDPAVKETLDDPEAPAEPSDLPGQDDAQGDEIAEDENSAETADSGETSKDGTGSDGETGDKADATGESGESGESGQDGESGENGESKESGNPQESGSPEGSGREDSPKLAPPEFDPLAQSEEQSEEQAGAQSEDGESGKNGEPQQSSDAPKDDSGTNDSNSKSGSESPQPGDMKTSTDPGDSSTDTRDASGKNDGSQDGSETSEESSGSSGAGSQDGADTQDNTQPACEKESSDGSGLQNSDGAGKTPEQMEGETSGGETSAAKSGNSTDSGTRPDPKTNPGEAFEQILQHCNKSAQSGESGEKPNPNSPKGGKPEGAEGAKKSESTMGKEDFSDGSQSEEKETSASSNVSENEEKNQSGQSSPQSGHQQGESQKQKKGGQVKPDNSAEAESKTSESSGGNKNGGEEASNQQGKGREGSNTPDKDGSPTGSGGEGPTGSKGGNSQLADHPTGVNDPGQRQGEGSSMKSGEKGSGGTKSSATRPKAGSSTELGAAGMGQVAQEEQAPVGDSFAAGKSDAANLEFAQKQTILALEHLRDALDRDDTSLLESLGWTREQAEEFLREWEARNRDMQRTDLSEAERQTREQAFRGLGLSRTTHFERGTGATHVRTTVRDARRLPPPEPWKEQFEAFSRGVAGGK